MTGIATGTATLNASMLEALKKAGVAEHDAREEEEDYDANPHLVWYS